MKPIHLRIVLMSLVLPLTLFSQNVQNMYWGVRAGINAGTPYGKAEKGATGSVGIGPRLGLFIRHRVNDRLDVQGEAIYSIKGGTYGTPVSGDTLYEQVIHGITYYIPTYYNGWVDGKFDNRYIDFPLQARYHIGQKFNMLFGPQISYLVKGNNSGTADIDIGEDYSHVTDEPFDESAAINKWDYSFILGCDYETFKGFSFNAGLSIGLRTIMKDGYDKFKGTIRNIYLQSTFGYRFGRRLNDK